jgi:hypothetical protein
VKNQDLLIFMNLKLHQKNKLPNHHKIFYHLVNRNPSLSQMPLDFYRDLNYRIWKLFPQSKNENLKRNQVHNLVECTKINNKVKFQRRRNHYT